MHYPEDIKTKRTSTSEEEIDLSKLFVSIGRGIGRFFKGLFRLFFLFVDTFFSNFRTIVALIAVGGLLGLIYFYTARPYYESHMTLGSDYYKGELLDNSIQNLNAVCAEGNAPVLATLLKIPVAKAEKIRKITVSPIISQNYRALLDLYSRDEKDSKKLDSLLVYNDQSNFQLNVEVYDTTALKGLDTTLVNYIRQNDYVNKRIQVDRLNLANLREKLSRESGNLDTLKKNLASSLRTGTEAGRNGANNVILGERSVNPIDVYKEDLNIYNQRQEVERLLALNSEIEIIEKFIPYAEPQSGTLLKNVAKGTLLGVIFSLLYVFYLILRDGLQRFRLTLAED